MLIIERVVWWCESCGKEILFDGPGVIKVCPYCGRKLVLTAGDLISENLTGVNVESQKENQIGNFRLGAFARLARGFGFQFKNQGSGKEAFRPFKNCRVKIQNQR